MAACCRVSAICPNVWRWVWRASYVYTRYCFHIMYATFLPELWLKILLLYKNNTRLHIILLWATEISSDIISALLCWIRFGSDNSKSESVCWHFFATVRCRRWKGSSLHASENTLVFMTAGNWWLPHFWQLVITTIFGNLHCC